MAKDIWW